MSSGVTDNPNRRYEHNGLVLQACGVDDIGDVCAVDVIVDGRHIYCLPINHANFEDANAYMDALRLIFARITS